MALGHFLHVRQKQKQSLNFRQLQRQKTRDKTHDATAPGHGDGTVDVGITSSELPCDCASIKLRRCGAVITKAI